MSDDGRDPGEWTREWVAEEYARALNDMKSGAWSRWPPPGKF